jgi:hypothetical protein
VCAAATACVADKVIRVANVTLFQPLVSNSCFKFQTKVVSSWSLASLEVFQELSSSHSLGLVVVITDELITDDLFGHVLAWIRGYIADVRQRLFQNA